MTRTAVNARGNKFGPLTLHPTQNATLVIRAKKHPGQKEPLSSKQFNKYLEGFIGDHLEALDKEGKETMDAVRAKELEDRIEEREVEDEADRTELEELRYSMAGAKSEGHFSCEGCGRRPGERHTDRCPTERKGVVTQDQCAWREVELEAR